MKNHKILVKVLRITAAVLAMAAQVLLACVG